MTIRALLFDADEVLQYPSLQAAASLGIHGICFANAKDGRAQLALRQLLAQLGVDTGTG